MQSAKARLKLSSKGQLVIPKYVRESLNIREGDELLLELGNNEMILKPTQNTANSKRLRGILKNQSFDPLECEAILKEAEKSLFKRE